VLQDPTGALNPRQTVYESVAEGLRIHGVVAEKAEEGISTSEPELVAEALSRAGIRPPERFFMAYPHELSGGQRQRVVIAMALARDPKLVVADEPTSALDVTVQAQIMELLLRLRAELGFALVFVSHDLALVSDVCDGIAVMYGGHIVEHGTTAAVLAAPAHHYTRGLLGSVLSLESQAPRLVQISGTVPSPADFPAGCRFADRCPYATDVCRERRPALAELGDHLTACHHPAPRDNAVKVAVHD
jgi:peptide/nickel transport system permease protein